MKYKLFKNKKLNESKTLNESKNSTINYDILKEEQPDFIFTNAFMDGEYLVLERWDKNKLTHYAKLEIFEAFGWLTEKDFYYAAAGEHGGWFDEYHIQAAEFFDSYEEYIESEIEQLLKYQGDDLEGVGLEVVVVEKEDLTENKTLNEATTGFTIAYPNGDFYIGEPHDLYMLMTDFLIDWDNDKTVMTEYEAENVASIRDNYEEVFYAALEGGNYWEGQDFEETFGRFSNYGIANALNTNENLQDYYQAEILGKSFILRDLLNIEFPLNALTNELGEYLGYDEEDFTEEELDSRVTVTEIYTDADGYIGAEIKFENEV